MSFAAAHHDQLVKTASYISVSLAACILFIKMCAWYATSSPAVFGTFVDSLFDVTTSLMNLIAIRIALSPADHEHRFGHHKVQDLVTFIQSVLFIGVGFFIIGSVIYNAYNQKHIQYDPNLVGYYMGACMCLTLIIVLYQRMVIIKTKSTIAYADYVHYVSDFATNAAVILSGYLSAKWYFVDYICSFGIGIYIVIVASQIMRLSVKSLIDEEFCEKDKQAIIDIVKKHKEVRGMHELKTRKAGNRMFAQFHIELDPNITLKQAHEITDSIYEQVRRVFHQCEIIIHQDPWGVEFNQEYKVF